MRINESCERCLLDKQVNRVKNYESDKREQYVRDCKNILSNRKDSDSAPYMVYLFNKAFEKYFGKLMDYSDIKREYNDLVLGLEKDIEKIIEESDDPLETSMVFARIGNYIDFGAMNHVEKDKLMDLFREAVNDRLDKKTYESFCRQCGDGKIFLILCDNCGEIVLDKLFLRQLKKHYPHLTCYAMVRGEEVLNDATVEDAVYCGLDKEATIVSNGAGVAGTVFDLISDEARKILEKSDVILSKGQGNYETASECGKRMFYSLLCKCDLFTQRFNTSMLDGIFVEEE